ncbi:MAG: hypothetical protein LBG06_01705 [Deltaproteobacteria bacterium]|jgi:hypothetical protein|nr:hypothetical protein [Deltaproteobacteria bacterium]
MNQLPETFGRLEACIEAMSALLAAPPREEETLGAFLAPPAAALAAADEGISLLERTLPCPAGIRRDILERLSIAASRLFCCSLYLGSVPRAAAVIRLMGGLPRREGNPLRLAYAIFSLMRFCLRTGDRAGAEEAWESLGRVEGVPPEHMWASPSLKPKVNFYLEYGTTRGPAGGGFELVLPAGPMLIRTYSYPHARTVDHFPFQVVSGLEGYRGILAEAAVNRMRMFANAEEPDRAAQAFEEHLSCGEYRTRPEYVVPAVCSTASAWARAGNPERFRDTVSLMPPPPWPLRPVYGQLPRLCEVDAYRFSGALDKALAAYRAWPADGLREIGAVPWAITTARLSGDLCRAGEMAAAERMILGLRRLGGDLGLEVAKAEAALGIMDACASKGRFRKAERYRRGIESLGRDYNTSHAWGLFRVELKRLKADAALSLLARLAAKGRAICSASSVLDRRGRPGPGPASGGRPASPASPVPASPAAPGGGGPAASRREWRDAAHVSGDRYAEPRLRETGGRGLPAGARAGSLPDGAGTAGRRRGGDSPGCRAGADAANREGEAGAGSFPGGGWPASLAPGAPDAPGAPAGPACGGQRDGLGYPAGDASAGGPAAWEEGWEAADGPEAWSHPRAGGFAVCDAPFREGGGFTDRPAEPSHPVTMASGVLTRRVEDLRVGLKAARILSRRVEDLLRRGAVRAAAQALAGFESLPPSPETAAARCAAAAKVISLFATEGDLLSAEAVFRATGMSRGARRHPRFLCATALALMNACLASGAPRCAAETFSGLTFEGTSPGTLAAFAGSSGRAVAALLLAGDLDAAEALQRDMIRLGRAPEVAAARARSALDLVLALEGAGLHDRSLAIYAGMEAGVQELDAARGRALRCLISGAARKGDYGRVLALRDTVRSFENPREAHLLRVRALHEITSLVFSGRHGPGGGAAPPSGRRGPLPPGWDPSLFPMLPGEGQGPPRRGLFGTAEPWGGASAGGASGRDALRDLTAVSAFPLAPADGAFAARPGADTSAGGRFADTSAGTAFPWAAFPGGPLSASAGVCSGALAFPALWPAEEEPVCPSAARLIRHLREGDLVMAEAFYSITDLNDILPASARPWALALEALARLCLDRDRPEGAVRIFADMTAASTGSLRPLAEARARVGARLVLALCERDRLDGALVIHDELASMPVTEALARARAWAAAALAPRLARSGRGVQALGICLGLLALPRTPDVKGALARIGPDLLPHLDSLPDKAAAVFRGIADAAGGSGAVPAAAARVMDLYASEGRNGRASDFYLEFLASHPLESFPAESLRPLALSLYSLSESCLRAGLPAKAAAVSRHLCHPAYRDLPRELGSSAGRGTPARPCGEGDGDDGGPSGPGADDGLGRRAGFLAGLARGNPLLTVLA